MEGRPLDEATLVERARGGDQEAYGELVERHAGIVHRTAYLITGSAAEAEDAAQETFVAAWRALPRFRPGAPLRPWLLRIAANAARNRRRAAGRREGVELRLADRLRTGDAAPSPEAAAEAAEGRAALLRALRGLSEDDRQVIVFRHVVGLDVAETAAVLGCREGTVKSRSSRALQRLRARLAAEEVGP